MIFLQIEFYHYIPTLGTRQRNIGSSLEQLRTLEQSYGCRQMGIVARGINKVLT